MPDLDDVAESLVNLEDDLGIPRGFSLKLKQEEILTDSGNYQRIFYV